MSFGRRSRMLASLASFQSDAAPTAPAAPEPPPPSYSWPELALNRLTASQPIPPATEALIRRILGEAIQTPRVAGIAERLGQHQETLSKALHVAGAPSPRKWIGLARLFAAAEELALQGTTVREAARRTGWPDPFTLSNAMMVSTGHRPKQIKAMGTPALDLLVNGWQERVLGSHEESHAPAH